MEKRVLITGSSRGIGKETALYLAKNGFNIVLHCHKNTKMAQEVSDEIKTLGADARILQFNIQNREECKRVLEKIYQKTEFITELSLTQALHGIMFFRQWKILNGMRF